MSSLKKRGRVWYIKFSQMENGHSREVTRSLKTTRKEIALNRQKEIDQMIRRGEADPFRPGFEMPDQKPAWYSVETCIEDYLEERAGLAYETRRNDKYVLEKWMNSLNTTDKPIDCVQLKKDVKPFFTRRSVKPQTLESELQRFRTFWNWLLKEGRVETDETRPIRLPENTIEYYPKMITEREFKKMIAAFRKHEIERRERPYYRPWMEQPWFVPAITLIYQTGVRLSEVGKKKQNKKSGMQGKNLIWEGPDVHYVYVSRSKTNSERLVPVSPELNGLLKAYFEIRAGANVSFVPGPEEYVFVSEKGVPLSSRNVYNQFKTYCKKAGLPDGRTVHGMRHARITSWIEDGFSLKDASVMAGHSTIATTEIYTHLAAKRLRNMMLDIERRKNGKK